MNKAYELTVLIHPDLESKLDESIAKIRDIIVSNKGEIIKEDNWGKKKLAYKINKEDFAMYVYFEVSLPAEAPDKISSTLNITEEALRYLLVKVDEKGRRALEEAKAKRSSSDDEKEEE